MTTKRAKTAKEREEALRKRYAAKYCVCGRPKGMRDPFCKKDMAVLGEAKAPRALLHGELDDIATAAAWETCLAVLKHKGWVKDEVTLG
jgi:hypothetical protein